MNLEMYLQAFEDGESTTISRSWLRNVFGSEISEVDDERWHLSYDDSEWCDIHLRFASDDPADVKTVVIDRPCDDQRLWATLAHVLGLGNFVLYWPGSRPIIGSPGVEEHLPADMIDALGTPIIAMRGSEIRSQLPAT